MIYQLSWQKLVKNATIFTVYRLDYAYLGVKHERCNCKV